MMASVQRWHCICCVVSHSLFPHLCPPVRPLVLRLGSTAPRAVVVYIKADLLSLSSSIFNQQTL